MNDEACLRGILGGDRGESPPPEAVVDDLIVHTEEEVRGLGLQQKPRRLRSEDTEGNEDKSTSSMQKREEKLRSHRYVISSKRRGCIVMSCAGCLIVESAHDDEWLVAGPS